ncbi:MAG: L-histidine N(alpha)-methyltransferase, partial [Betaproteobacteria bacterium]
QRIEMHLEARHRLTVSWLDEQGQRHERVFQAGQTLHTENSCKWTLEGFTALLQRAGFTGLRHWTDPHQAFAVFWAQAH